MLSRRRPFDTAGTPLATVLVRRRSPPKPLRDHVPQLDDVWDAVIRRCLEREPANRFQRAGDVIAALKGERDPSPSPSDGDAGFFGRLARKLR